MPQGATVGWLASTEHAYEGVLISKGDEGTRGVLFMSNRLDISEGA